MFALSSRYDSPWSGSELNVVSPGVATLQGESGEEYVFLRLKWHKKEDGRWHGEWMWEVEDEPAEYEEQKWERYTSHPTFDDLNMPLEVLLIVCDLAIATSYPQAADLEAWLHDWYDSQGIKYLRNLVLV